MSLVIQIQLSNNVFCFANRNKALSKIEIEVESMFIGI